MTRCVGTIGPDRYHADLAPSPIERAWQRPEELSDDPGPSEPGEYKADAGFPHIFSRAGRFPRTACFKAAAMV